MIKFGAKRKFLVKYYKQDATRTKSLHEKCSTKGDVKS